MIKILTTIFITLAFSFTSVLCAGADVPKPSPESMLICGTGLGDLISAHSLPDSINAERCEPNFVNKCAPCLISLEQQGCMIVDVIVMTFRIEEYGVNHPGTSYLLSCVKP